MECTEQCGKKNVNRDCTSMGFIRWKRLTNKILITHHIWLLCCEALPIAREYAIHDTHAQTMSSILQQILPGDHEITILVQIEKLAVQHIEVLIAEEELVHVDIILSVHHV